MQETCWQEQLSKDLIPLNLCWEIGHDPLRKPRSQRCCVCVSTLLMCEVLSCFPGTAKASAAQLTLSILLPVVTTSTRHITPPAQPPFPVNPGIPSPAHSSEPGAGSGAAQGQKGLTRGHLSETAHAPTWPLSPPLSQQDSETQF